MAKKHKPNIIRVSKLDAAERQLSTAIDMMFNRGCVLSIHTLTLAAFGILKDIAEITKESEFHNQTMKIGVKLAGSKAAFMSDLFVKANFLKHANRDHEDILSFDETDTDLMLIGACAIYEDLNRLRDKKVIDEITAFKIWSMMVMPEYHFVDSKRIEIKEPYNFNKIATRAEMLAFGKRILGDIRAPF